MSDSQNNQNTGSGDGSSTLILGKFKDQAALESAYTELQSKFTKSRQAPMTEGADISIPNQRSDGPLTFDAFADYFSEFSEKGELAPESYDAIQTKYGLAPELVDRFIANEKVSAEAQKTQLLNEVGGADVYQKAVDWAAANTNQDFIDDFNADLGSGDLRLARRAMKELVNEYTKNTGGDLTLLQGTRQASTVKPFASKLEMGRAISAAKTPADHAMVDARLAATNQANW